MKSPSLDRRTLLGGGVSAGLFACGAAAIGAPAAAAVAPSPRRGPRFGLHYAPHFGMFRHHAGADLIDQIKFMHDEGFTALEDNGLKGRDVAIQERIGAELERLGMVMGVFVCNMGLGFGKPFFASGNADWREQFVEDCRTSIEVAKRVNAKWCTVVCGDADRRLAPEFQTANAVEMLRRGAEVLEPHGLVMVIEPLNTLRDHPGQFLTRIPQAYEICRAVDSPSCKILDDLYHQQITEGNLIPNLDAAWAEIGYIQTGDNPGRKEPGTGEINYLNVFRHLKRKGYQGVVGMEHGNSMGGREGERAVIDAYAAADAD
jgi:hydroxypyruvate isomerase